MIFSPALAELVLAGRKTVTRRRTDSGARYRVGNAYAVQDRDGGRSLGRIRILDNRAEPLQRARLGSEFHLEGFAGVPELVAYWTQLYGSFDDDLVVRRIEFELINPTKEIQHG